MTPLFPAGIVRAVHGDTNKKHRHDVGAPDHAAESMEFVTGGIQFALGACIVATIGLLIWAAKVAAG